MKHERKKKPKAHEAFVHGNDGGCGMVIHRAAPQKDFDDDDAGALNPFYVIIAGLIGKAIFIAALITIVSWVVP